MNLFPESESESESDSESESTSSLSSEETDSDGVYYAKICKPWKENFNFRLYHTMCGVFCDELGTDFEDSE